MFLLELLGSIRKGIHYVFQISYFINKEVKPQGDIGGLFQDPVASGFVGCHLASLDRLEDRVSRTDLYVISAEPAWMTLCYIISSL